MMTPRKPTQEELKHLKLTIGNEAVDEEFFGGKELMQRVSKALKEVAYVAVFDEFEWQDPAFEHHKLKKLMVVVWNEPKAGIACCPDVFAWDKNGCLLQITEVGEGNKMASNLIRISKL